MTTPIPTELLTRPFHLSEALALGLSAKSLSGARFNKTFPLVYSYKGLVLTPPLLAYAAVLSLGDRVAASHESGLAVWGVDIGTRGSVHVSTHKPSPTRIKGITVHRNYLLGPVHMIDGCRVLSAERCLVDAATRRSILDLVAAGDWLIRDGHMTRDSFLIFVTETHFDGVVRARRVAELLDVGSESPRESYVRVILELAGLPRPVCNRTYGDQFEPFARPDMSYPNWKVAVEYDGRQHGLSLAQRTHDVWRREQMELLGWRFVVITAADLKQPRDIVNRVHAALVDHGYRGPRPTFPAEWHEALAA